MRSVRGELVAVTVGVLALIGPILLSLQLAWNQTIATEKAKDLRYASELIRRGDETAQQFARAVQLLAC